MTKLLALIDGSIYSQSICDYTAWIAVRTSASVELLHVLGRRDLSSAPADLSGNLDVDARDILLAELASLDEQKAKLSQKRGRVILNEAKARVLAAGAPNVSTKLRHGDLIETVNELEADSDLIIVGKRGEAADFAKLHLGSNLERIVRASQKPIFVASRSFQTVKRFLIAFDGGASSLKAVNHIAQGSLFPGLECHLLTVGSETAQAQDALGYAGKRLRDAGYAVEANFIQGQPDSAIAAYAEAQQIDLLVMGAYGHSRLRNLIIGSTTTEMIRSCKIPVMLFR
jgi:nucleotide-binding universal stress UspA family protein